MINPNVEIKVDADTSETRGEFKKYEIKIILFYILMKYFKCSDLE